MVEAEDVTGVTFTPEYVYLPQSSFLLPARLDYILHNKWGGDTCHYIYDGVGWNGLSFDGSKSLVIMLTCRLWMQRRHWALEVLRKEQVRSVSQVRASEYG
jgi:hypothetical protein